MRAAITIITIEPGLSALGKNIVAFQLIFNKVSNYHFNPIKSIQLSCKQNKYFEYF